MSRRTSCRPPAQRSFGPALRSRKWWPRCRARLIPLGPGDPALLGPGVRAVVLGTRGERLWVGQAAGQSDLEAWLGAPTPIAEPARWQRDVQARLLRQAAGRAKSQAG